MLKASSSYIPGIFPLITRYDPAHRLAGKDNLGMGYTQHNEQFLLKNGGQLGTSEFIGAKVCDACGIPACQPTIVTLQDIYGERHVFGSRIESGIHNFDQTDVQEWHNVLEKCTNKTMFSAMLAVDLVLGNDDRHWNNWLVQITTDDHGLDCYRLRTLDFSRAWPTRHPAQHPLRHDSSNTWGACKNWALLGVDFDQQEFYETCVRIGLLSAKWLRRAVLHHINGVFLTSAEVDTLCIWWENNIKRQVLEAIYSLEHGARP